MDNELYELKKQLMDSFFRVKELVFAFPSGMHAHMANLNINMNELSLMKGIEGNTLDSDENIRMSDIREQLYITKAAVSQMLGVLEKKGYITRDIDKNNRRTLIVTLTPEGKEALKYAEKGYDDAVTKIIMQLGVDDTKQFTRIINRLADILNDTAN